ncbi:hypothetical protein H4Q26_016606 [Puccinia striiformis f. sp. tritici PST-130]|nr:hypothetical protein H4Q26_016606 [Puccinia striiformis f. sp. tritici PST-130]
MHVVRLQNGVSELASITGSGCMTGTSIGCFASMIQPEVDKDTQSGLLMNLKSMHQDFGGDTLIASILGISTINVVAELIHQSENEKSDFGPNNLKMRILDRICSSRRMEPSWKRINAEMNISSVFFHSDAENNFPPASRDATIE